MSNYQTWFNLAIGALAVVASFYAARAGKRGKDADLRQQTLAVVSAAEQADRTQRFSEIVRSLEEARADLEYYKRELGESRAAEDRMEKKIDAIQNEWRIRHRELLERCQEMSDVMAKILNSAGGNLDPEQRAQIREAIGRVRRHIAHDHEEIDDTLGGGGGIHGTSR